MSRIPKPKMMVPPQRRIMSQPKGADANCIRVLLQPGTIVMVRSIQSLESWRGKYPNMRVLDPIPWEQAGDTPEAEEK